MTFWQCGISFFGKIFDNFDTVHRELHLQRKLITLQELLAQTQHEPRLKGPFPIQLYRSILTSLQTILDKLHSMRCVTTREEWYCFSLLSAWHIDPNTLLHRYTASKPRASSYHRTNAFDTDCETRFHCSCQ